MKAKRTHTGFGLYDTTRQIARRWQRVIDETENQPRDDRDEPSELPDLAEFGGTEPRPLAA